MNMPSILNFEEAAKLLNVSTEVIQDIVKSGDLPAIGTNKNLIKLCDLNSLMGEKPVVRPVDFTGKLRYTPDHSILIEEIIESEWENMKKQGKKSINRIGTARKTDGV